LVIICSTTHPRTSISVHAVTIACPIRDVSLALAQLACGVPSALSAHDSATGEAQFSPDHRRRLVIVCSITYLISDEAQPWKFPVARKDGSAHGLQSTIARSSRGSIAAR
jgi:hypothetical protein